MWSLLTERSFRTPADAKHGMQVNCNSLADRQGKGDRKLTCDQSTPKRTYSEPPSPLPGVNKFWGKERRYTKGEINLCSTISPSMPTIIRLAKICKSAKRHR